MKEKYFQNVIDTAVIQIHRLSVLNRLKSSAHHDVQDKIFGRQCRKSGRHRIPETESYIRPMQLIGGNKPCMTNDL